MKFGITFDLKGDGPIPEGVPDDFFEEFDAPDTVAAIAAVLRDLGHTPIELGDGRRMIEKVLADPPDMVFNFAEGQGIGRSREARVPAVLEMLGIPYTGSDPATLAVALDKDWTRRLVSTAGVAVPRGATVWDPDHIPAFAATGLRLPAIVKPICEGSSKGIRGQCLIERADDFAPVVASLLRDYRQPVLVEEFVSGEELTVGIVGNAPPEVLGILRVVPRKPTDRFVYSIEVKRDYANRVDYECPPRLPAAVLERVERSALLAYSALGCRDVARIDYRLQGDEPYFIEANPLPGLNPISGDLVLMATLQGIGHADLIRRIVAAARHRVGR